MQRTPSKLIPPGEAEARSAALRSAVFEVRHIRNGAEHGAAVSSSDVADAFEAVLDLVAPHWRMALGEKR